MKGEIELGVLAEFIIYVNMLTWPVATVGWITSIVQQAEASQKRINEFLKKDLKDEVVIFQTDTVYGLGCLISSEKGVERIYEIKKRDGNKPLAVLCANLEQVKSIVSNFELGRKIGEKYYKLLK